MSVSAQPPEPARAEDPQMLAANLNVGVRLWASAVAFIFVAFVFALFYLRAVNSNGDWRPPHTNPSQGYGVAILVCVLAAAAVLDLARRRATGWLAPAVLALALGLAVVALQILQYTQLGFTATDGGYASVFYGWTAVFLAFWFGALYWVETIVAGAIRGAEEPVGADGRELADLRPSGDASVVYVYVCAGVAVVGYVLLYLVK